MIVNESLGNVSNFALVQYVYDAIKTLNDSLVACELSDITRFVSKATDITEVDICDVLAYDVIDMLYYAGLLVYDNGYKVLPTL